MSDEIKSPEELAGIEVLKTVGLPAQPHILIKVQQELNKEHPDVDVLAKLISDDISVAAHVLKLANSALYAGKRKVDSIDQAFIRLGMKIFKNVVVTSIAKDKLGTPTALNEEVWHHTAITGWVCDRIAHKVCPALTDMAYTLGLFHDCGIPLLEKRFPEYVDMGASALRLAPDCKNNEMEKFSTNHGIVAYIITKTWGLDKNLSEAIQHHHDDRIDPSLPETVKAPLALLIMAEHLIQASMSGEVDIFMQTSDDSLLGDLKKVLTISDDDIADLRHEIDHLINERLNKAEG